MARFASTTTPLNDTEIWVSGTNQSDTYDTITGIIKASHSGILFIEQSSDGTNWDVSTSNTFAAGVGEGVSETIYAPLWRVRIENNSGSDQTYLRASFRSAASGTR